MENEIDILITVLHRVKNCDKALSILEEMSQNGLFSYNLDHLTYSQEWIKDVDMRKWIDHMKNQIKECLRLIKEERC